MNSPDQHRVDEYILGLMKPAERNKFEQELASDADLQIAVQERQELITYVDALGDMQMKERVRRIHVQEVGGSAKVRRMSVMRYAIAAGLALAIGVAIWLFMRPPLNERLYAANYTPYEITFSARGGDNVEKQLVEASRFYKSGNYTEAALIFKNALTENIDNEDGVRLALGISEMEVENFSNSLNQFDRIIDNVDSPYREQALWYAALVSLKKNDIFTASKYLDPLVEDTESFYHVEAKELASALSQ